MTWTSQKFLQRQLGKIAMGMAAKVVHRVVLYHGMCIPSCALERRGPEARAKFKSLTEVSCVIHCMVQQLTSAD